VASNAAAPPNCFHCDDEPLGLWGGSAAKSGITRGSDRLAAVENTEKDA
jgi:hypothetical protein